MITLLSLGHWMIDRIIQLSSNYSLTQPLPTQHIHSNIVTRIGGSGYHFARAAKIAGFHYVASIIPVDKSGNKVFDAEIKEQEIEPIYFLSKKNGAEAVLIYDVEGCRISFGQRGANLDIPIAAVEHLEKTQYDIVFVSGHLFEDPKTFNHSVSVMSTAKNGGAYVVLDLVPHHIYKLYEGEELEKILKLSDGLITMKDTLFASMKIISPQRKIQIEDVINTYSSWLCLQDGTDKNIIYERCGKSFNNYSASTDYKKAKYKAGSLDISAARELFKFITKRRIE